jgi:hypothetical protein
MASTEQVVPHWTSWGVGHMDSQELVELQTQLPDTQSQRPATHVSDQVQNSPAPQAVPLSEKLHVELSELSPNAILPSRVVTRASVPVLPASRTTDPSLRTGSGSSPALQPAKLDASSNPTIPARTPTTVTHQACHALAKRTSGQPMPAAVEWLHERGHS